jgi:hypothetical protein
MELYAIVRRNGWRTAADLPVDEIIPIADTVIVRPDPQPATS